MWLWRGRRYLGFIFERVTVGGGDPRGYQNGHPSLPVMLEYASTNQSKNLDFCTCLFISFPPSHLYGRGWPLDKVLRAATAGSRRSPSDRQRRDAARSHECACKPASPNAQGNA